jgi:hypothetical protein
MGWWSNLWGRDQTQTAGFDPRQAPGPSRGLLGWARKFLGGWPGPRAAVKTEAGEQLSREVVHAGPSGVVLPWFLPFYDDRTGETPQIRAAYRLMWASPQIKGATLGKIFGVASLDLKVQPVDRKNPTDRKIADFVRWNLTRRLAGGVPGLVWSVLSGGLPDGYSICEKVERYQAEGKYQGHWALVALKPKMTGQDVVPLTDSYRNVVGIQGLRYNSGVIFPPARFLIWRHLPLYDAPTGMSDYRAAYGDFWLYDTVKKLRGIHADKRAAPILLGKWTTAAQRQSIENTMAHARAQSWLSIPKDAQLEALNWAGEAETVYKSFMDDLQENMYLGIRGATLIAMTGGQGEQRGSSQVHKSEAELRTWHLAQSLQSLLNDEETGLVKDIVDTNYVVSEYPPVTLSAVDVNEMTAEAGLDKTLVDMGLALSREETYEKYGRTPPTDPNDELKPPGPPGGGGPGGGPGGGGGGTSPGRAGHVPGLLGGGKPEGPQKPEAQKPEKHAEPFARQRGDDLAGAVREFLEELAALAGVELPHISDETIRQALDDAQVEHFAEWEEGKHPRKRGQFTSKGNEQPGGDHEQHEQKVEQKAQGILGKLKGKAAALPGKIRDWAVKKYGTLKEKYGKAGALLVMGATLAIVATPLPGTALAAPLPELVARAVHAAVRGIRGTAPAETHDEDGDIFRESTFAEPEHRGKGPGGGQFVATGGGGAGPSEPERTEMSVIPKAQDILHPLAREDDLEHASDLPGQSRLRERDPNSHHSARFLASEGHIAEDIARRAGTAPRNPERAHHLAETNLAGLAQNVQKDLQGTLEHAQQLAGAFLKLVGADHAAPVVLAARQIEDRMARSRERFRDAENAALDALDDYQAAPDLEHWHAVSDAYGAVLLAQERVTASVETAHGELRRSATRLLGPARAQMQKELKEPRGDFLEAQGHQHAGVFRESTFDEFAALFQAFASTRKEGDRWQTGSTYWTREGGKSKRISKAQFEGGGASAQATRKPPAEPKEKAPRQEKATQRQKPTVEDAVARVADLRQKGRAHPDDVKEMHGLLMGLTVAQQQDFGKRLNLPSSGPRAVRAQKLAEGALAAARLLDVEDTSEATAANPRHQQAHDALAAILGKDALSLDLSDHEAVKAALRKALGGEPGKAEPAPAAKEPAAPKSQPQHSVAAAFSRLSGPRGSQVSVADLRDALPEMSEEHLASAIEHLRREGALSGSGHESRHGDERDRRIIRGAVKQSDGPVALLTVRDPDALARYLGGK